MRIRYKIFLSLTLLITVIVVMGLIYAFNNAKEQAQQLARADIHRASQLVNLTLQSTVEDVQDLADTLVKKNALAVLMVLGLNERLENEISLLKSGVKNRLTTVLAFKNNGALVTRQKTDLAHQLIQLYQKKTLSWTDRKISTVEFIDKLPMALTVAPFFSEEGQWLGSYWVSKPLNELLVNKNYEDLSEFRVSFHPDSRTPSIKIPEIGFWEMWTYLIGATRSEAFITESFALPGNEAKGSVVVKINYHKYLIPLENVLVSISAVALVGLLLILFIVYAFSLYFSRPLERLTQALKMLETGDFAFSIQTQRKDEIGDLVEGFLAMRASLQQRTKKLEKLAHTLDLLLSILTHDLAPDMRASYNRWELMQKDLKSMDLQQIEERIQSIIKSGGQFKFTLSNLTTLVKQQQGQLTITPEQVPLRDLLENVLKTVNDTAQKKSIALRVNHQEGSFFADYEMILIVLRNIVMNALKFTHAQGEVIISVKNGPQKIKIMIRDNGIGIAAETLEFLFDPSFRKTKIGTEGEVGKGIGLILCRALVEMNKGEIEATSVLGKGSTFTITLPTTGNGMV